MRGASRLLVMGLLAVCACDKDAKRAPYGPSDGMGRIDVVAVGGDAGKPGRDDDGGEPDDELPDAGGDAAVAFASCERIQGSRVPGSENLMQITSTTMPVDFIVTRQAQNWNSDCEKPVLSIELSDGVCPTGSGHELIFDLSVNAIEDGVIRLGENQLTEETEQTPIKVRYRRPLKFNPRGTWGTCQAVSGLLLFGEAPELVAGGNLQAYFQMMLTACDENTTGTMEVVGTFKLKLRSTLSEVCPSRTR